MRAGSSKSGPRTKNLQPDLPAASRLIEKKGEKRKGLQRKGAEETTKDHKKPELSFETD
jgi:hypothetical protein